MAEGTETRSDRRVQRTRRLLREALTSLVLERGWEEVSVQDICERADVGRSTFYSHFGDKEVLLTSGFEALREELQAHVRHAGGTGRLAFLEPLVVHTGEHRRLVRALVGHKSAQAVQRKFRALLFDLVQEDLGAGASPLQVHFVAGALVEVVNWWIDARTATSAEEVAARFRALAMAAIAGDAVGG